MRPRPRPHRAARRLHTVRTLGRWDCINARRRERAKESRFAACASLLTSQATGRTPPKRGAFRFQPRVSPLRQTGCWRKADSNSWSHFSARALEPLRNLSLRWDLRAAYRSEANLPPIPSECAWSVVVVTVLRGPRRGFAGYAITGFFGAGRGGVGRMRSDVVPGVEGLRTFGAPHRRAAPDPSETIA
jgi:hypothetical protein